MGIEVVRGRAFTTADFAREAVDSRHTSSKEPEARIAEFVSRTSPYIINEAFAKHYFPNADPLASSPLIVGIVKDVKLFAVKDEVPPLMFFVSRRPSVIRALQVRTAGDPSVIEPAIREAIQAVNPRLFLGMTTLSEASNRNIAKERMVAVVSGFFGLLGLSLACMGIFGVAANTVTNRTKDLGIRRALGAGTRSVIWECMRETLVVLTIGLVLGAVGAVVAVRVSAAFVADLLFGISATDAANLVAAFLLMVIVALAACTLPALRATRIDPLTVLREE
jgi:ABC-type antimicrobial peptide transport system permease subunit